MDATTVAVDLAKDVFEVALANRAGRIVDRRRLTRRQFERFVDELGSETTVVMEACGTAHYWGRRCQARGVAVRLLPVQYVRPDVCRNKTDRTDTEGMLEANRCAGIRPVPVKTREQQALQALHRVRTQWQATRTNRINVLRGLLREQGYPVPLGARTVLTRVMGVLEDPARALPASLRAPGLDIVSSAAPERCRTPLVSGADLKRRVLPVIWLTTARKPRRPDVEILPQLLADVGFTRLLAGGCRGTVIP